MTEVLVTVAVCAMALISIYVGLGVCFKTVDGVRKNQRATQVMLQTFELVRLYNWDQITTPGYLPGTVYATDTNIWTTPTEGRKPLYSGVVTTAPAPVNASYSGDLIMVTVQLNWTAGNIPHQRVMNTLMARQGLQNYVY